MFHMGKVIVMAQTVAILLLCQINIYKGLLAQPPLPRPPARLKLTNDPQLPK
jgi:hypothetical protein